LFVGREIQRLWQAHGSHGGESSSEVAKHFAIQLWLRECRRQVRAGSPSD